MQIPHPYEGIYRSFPFIFLLILRLSMQNGLSHLRTLRDHKMACKPL